MGKEAKDVADDVLVLRDANHNLTRAGMEQVLKAGGSVSHRRFVGTDADGRPLHRTFIIASLDQLPTAEELAQTPEEKAAAADDLDTQIAKLQARRATIKTDEKKSDKK